MTIDLITADPNENMPATLPTEIALFVQQIKAAIPQFNAAIAAFNFNATNTVSTTSLTIGTGDQTLTVATSKSFVEGMTARIARTSDPAKWMQGEVKSYNSGTGALVVTVRETLGSGGPHTDWTIHQPSYVTSVPTNLVRAHSPGAGAAGHGTTNTKIRRYTTLSENTGGFVTFSDDAANGSLFTVDISGTYIIKCGDTLAGTQNFGISKNSAQLTTAIESITLADRLAMGVTGGASLCGECIAIVYLSAGDLIRGHNGTTVCTDTSAGAYLSMQRIL